MKMQIVRFGDLYAIPSGNGLSRPTAVRGEGYRMIGMGELFANDIINDIEMDRVQMSDREKQSFFVEPDDLLFARQSLVAAGAGKCSIVKELEEPTTYESHLIRVRLDKNKCNPWYYFYLFKLPDNPIKTIVNQCAQAGIRGNELVKIKVPLPPRPYQDRIVSVLSTYDNLIEVNNKRIKVLEQIAENLYKEWFVRFRFPGHETTELENGIPLGWTQKRADQAIVFNPTIGDSKQDQYTIIPMESLSTSSMVLDSNSFVIQESLSGKRSQNGDTLFAKITPCLENGKTGFVMGMPEGTVCGGSTEFIVLRSKTLTSHYIYFLARSYYFRQTAILSMNGADGRQRVDEHKMKSTKIIQPPKAILDAFEGYVSPIFEMVHRLVVENNNLIKQRDLLLPRLMSGKLEV